MRRCAIYLSRCCLVECLFQLCLSSMANYYSRRSHKFKVTPLRTTPIALPQITDWLTLNKAEVSEEKKQLKSLLGLITKPIFPHLSAVQIMTS